MDWRTVSEAPQSAADRRAAAQKAMAGLGEVTGMGMGQGRRPDADWAWVVIGFTKSLIGGCGGGMRSFLGLGQEGGGGGDKRYMIRLTRISHASVVLNSDLIEHIESTPDTVISLTTGQKVVVLESCDEVIRRVVEFRRSLLHLPPVVQNAASHIPANRAPGASG
jgi:flagellar protein FlbD